MTRRTSCGASSEWEILLACAAPDSNPRSVPKQINKLIQSDELLCLAERHGVLPLLARRVEQSETLAALMSEEVRRRLREKRRALMLSTLSLTAELFRLTERFEEAGIEAVVVKGPTLAVQAYGDASLRQYSDLDFVMPHEAVLRAMDVMRAAGFVTQISPQVAEAGRVPGQFLFLDGGRNLIVELHTERTLRYFPRPLPLNDFFARRVRIPLDGREVPVFSPEDTLSFICVHGSKHLWERLRWIADVAALISRQKCFDWPRAVATARETGTERMVHLGLRLAMDLLNAPLPREIRAEVLADGAAGRLAEAVLHWLPSEEEVERGLFERACFRVQIRGDFLRGLRYLLRLALAPTEEDWGNNTPAARVARWTEAARRPLRLARKYRRAAP